VVGAANEQLLTPEDGDALHARGIVYAPDYVVNAGGLVSVLWERGETDLAGVTARTEAIAETVRRILDRAEREGQPPHRVADLMVEERLRAARAAARA
jgi:leucine dehydrogenase